MNDRGFTFFHVRLPNSTVRRFIIVPRLYPRRQQFDIAATPCLLYKFCLYRTLFLTLK
jgi:hypothetical protein